MSIPTAATPAAPAVAGRAVSPWAVLATVYLASIAAVMAQFAAPPLMPVLIPAFGIDLAAASSLMSVFSITGLLLALPAGLVLVRFGARATIVTSMASVVVGSLLGVATSEFGVLLAGRAVQGIAVGLVGVAAPAVVAGTFPAARRGLPMGIWATWVPVGGVLMYLLAPALATAFGWQAAWWLAAAVAGLAAVLVIPLVGGGPAGGPDAAPAGSGRGGAAWHDLRAGLAGRDIWLLATTFMLFATAMGGVNAFMAAFLVEERGVALAAAAAVSSLVLVGAVAGSFLAGWISDRIGSRRLVYTVAVVVLGLLTLLPFSVEAGLPLVLLAMGLASGAAPSVIFAAVPEVVPAPRLAGAGMAALMLGQSAGMVVGPILFAMIQPSFGWAAVGIAMAAVAMAGAAVGWMVRVR